MKILITGICGYLCSILARQLLSLGYQVKGYDNCSGRSTDGILEICSNPNFEFIKGDILNVPQLSNASKDCDLICHAAAWVGQPICSKFEDFAWLVNYQGSANVVGLNKPTIFFSTGSTLGNVKDSICTEETPCNPLSSYARAKYQAEQLFINRGDFIIYRYATAFGLSPALRLDLLPNDFCYQAWKNKVLVVSEPEVKRSFCHARDLMSAVCFGIQNFDKLKGEVYNVGMEEGNWSKQQLVDWIQKKTGCDVFYGKNYVDPDKRNVEISYKKINNAGWKASISIEQGLEELLKALPLIRIQNQYYQI